jgi:hypothetical protein
MHEYVALHRDYISLHIVPLLLAIDPIFPMRTKLSMIDDARDPSYFNFFSET